MAKGKGSGSGAASIVARLKARQASAPSPSAPVSRPNQPYPGGGGSASASPPPSQRDFIKPEDIRTASEPVQLNRVSVTPVPGSNKSVTTVSGTYKTNAVNVINTSKGLQASVSVNTGSSGGAAPKQLEATKTPYYGPNESAMSVRADNPQVVPKPSFIRSARPTNMLNAGGRLGGAVTAAYERIPQNEREVIPLALFAAADPAIGAFGMLRSGGAKVTRALPSFVEQKLATNLGEEGVAKLASQGKSVYGTGKYGTTAARTVLSGIGAGVAGAGASYGVRQGYDYYLSRKFNLPLGTVQAAQKARLGAEGEATKKGGYGEIARQLPNEVFASENVKKAGSQAFEQSLVSQGVSKDTAASVAKRQRETRSPYYIAQSLPTIFFSEVPGEVAGRSFLSKTFTKPFVAENTNKLGSKLYSRTFVPFLSAGIVEVQGGIGAAFAQQYERPTAKQFLAAEGLGVLSAGVVTPFVGSKVIQYDLLKNYAETPVKRASARVKGGLLRGGVEVLEGGQEYLGDKSADVLLKGSTRPKVVSFSFIPTSTTTKTTTTTKTQNVGFGLSTLTGSLAPTPVSTPQKGRPKSSSLMSLFTNVNTPTDINTPSETPLPTTIKNNVNVPIKTNNIIPEATPNQVPNENKNDINNFNSLPVFNESPVPTVVAAGWLPPIPLLFPAESGARGSGKNLPKTLINELQLGEDLLGSLLGGKNFLAGRLKIKKGKRKRSR